MEISELKKEIDLATQYRDSINLTTEIDKCVDYYEGRQWKSGEEIDSTRPKSQSNWVEMIVDAKVSGVLSGQANCKFISKDDPTAADMYNAFTASKWIELDMDGITDQAVNEAAIKRAGIVYLYWDNEAKQSAGVKRGGVLAELIDIRDFYVANPEILDVQKQKYIIVSKKIDKEVAQSLCDKGVDIGDIGTDTDLQGKSNLVTVYTKFYRINGEVHYIRFTESVILHAPRSMRPSCDCNNEGNDPARYGLKDDMIEDTAPVGVKFDKYPFAVFTWKNRDKCFYGRGEVEGLVINQKAFNNARALEAESLQVTSIPKFVKKKGAEPKGQVITNNPRQKLVDNKDGDRGYYYLVAPQVNTALSNYADKLINDTRVSTNSTEIMTGELERNLSAIAYAQLQAQADKPIKRLRRRYYRFIKQIGKILECYYKLYYNAEEEAQFRSEDGGNAEFVGSDYSDTEFSIEVVVGESGEYTQFGEISLAKESLETGSITFTQYLTLLPTEVFPSRDKIIEMIAANEENKFQAQQQTIEELSQELEQVAEVVKNIVPTIALNEKLKQMLAEQNAVISELTINNANYKGVIDGVLQEMRVADEISTGQE